MKRFSVVVCTYNRAVYLRQTLESVARQEYHAADFELVIVDNNSTDATEKECVDFQEQHPHLAIAYFKELQQGISHGRNRGVAEAQGEWIVFLDDDETIAPDFLTALETFIIAYPTAELIAEPVVPVYESQQPEWLSPYTMRLITGAFDKGKQVRQLKAKDYPGTGHASFKRELFFRYGAFNTELGRKGDSLMGAEDKDFFLRLIAGGVRCYYVPEAVIYHHIPDSKLTDEFFRRITLAIGKSERIRTQGLSSQAYCRRLFSEAVKWGATIVLWCYYLLTLRPSKGNRLLLFRYYVTKGLLL